MSFNYYFGQNKNFIRIAEKQAQRLMGYGYEGL